MNFEIPEAYGGLGLSCLTHCLILEEISYGCAGVNTTLAGQHAGRDAAHHRRHRRAEEEVPRPPHRWRRRADLRRLRLLASPTPARDVAGMRTRVEKDGDDYVLNGQKRWITNGGVASFYTMFATLDPKLKHKGITCFVVDANTPGRQGRQEGEQDGPALRRNTTDVIFEDVQASRRARSSARRASGFKVAMKTFDRSRPWIAAGAAGIIRRALDESRAYALERKTFGVPIAQHQAVQFMLAEMAIAYETTRLLCHKARGWSTAASSTASSRAYAKAYGADAAMRVATDAVQIFGGYGYTKEYPVEKLMRDAKLLQIYEGTSRRSSAWSSRATCSPATSSG